MVTIENEGTEVLARLQTELNSAGDDLAHCQSIASQLDGHMQELLARRGEALVQLAHHFLPEISRPAIEKTFSTIRDDLLLILARKESRERELKSRLEAAGLEDRRLGGELDGVTHKLNELVARRDELEAQVAEILKANDDFQTRSRLALQAEEQLHRNEQRVESIEKDAAEKRPNYEKSRLFRYLYDRGFGTTEYQGAGWTRSIDTWLARLIGFGNARNGYEYLCKTPKLVADEVARRRAQFNELMQQVEALQQAEADKTGLSAVLHEGETLGAQRDRLVQEIESLRKRTQDDQRSLADLARTQNEFYTEAIERFRGFLGETKLAILRERARQTPEPEDDAVVAELASLNQQIEDLNSRLTIETRRRKEAERIHEGLDQVVRRYRQENFDSQRSCFTSGFDLHGMLDQFQAGDCDAETLWQAIRRAQQFRPHWIQSTTQDGMQVMASPAGRVLLGTILDVANAALRESAQRGVQRRGADMFPGYPPARQESSSPPDSGGFTSGQGF